jgi:hypothetical protein
VAARDDPVEIGTGCVPAVVPADASAACLPTNVSGRLFELLLHCFGQPPRLHVLNQTLLL